MNILRKIFLPIIFIVFLFSVNNVFAQEAYDEYQSTWKGRVVEVLSTESVEIEGTETKEKLQSIRVEILDGPRAGEEIVIEDDYLKLEKGDRLFFDYFLTLEGREFFQVKDIYRMHTLIVFIALFIFVVIIFGGFQGMRSLMALAGSFFALFYVLMPGLLAGWSPVLSSILVAGIILFVAIFFTHGFNRESAVSYFGTMFAVALTGVLAYLAVDLNNLSGFATEESVYLNFNTQGVLDFKGLLLGAIIIGVLGVLDDIAVTQSAVVTELFNANPNLTRREVYKRAIRIGREHVSALVNTLVLAYTGSALPVLLYFYASPSTILMSVNSEIFATEIIRAIVGSIGLILTVPVVTFLAVIYLKGQKSKSSSHHHHHGHAH
jgi:uncharacterized membrane protein